MRRRLVLKGFAQLLQRDPGFDPRPLLAVEVAIPAERYPDSAARRFLEPVLAEVRGIPEVDSAAAISLLP